MKFKMSELLAISMLILFVSVGCKQNSEPAATQTSTLDVKPTPEPEPPARVQGTTDQDVVAFVESLIELKAIEDAFALIHPECLPALQGEEQRKVCDQKLTSGIQSNAQDIFFVSQYDSSKSFWKPGEFETAVEPQLVVATNADWTKAYFPFQDGFTKWLLAKDGNQWRLVMPAVTNLHVEREQRNREGAASEFKMTSEEKGQSAIELAKTLPEEFKAELKKLIDANNRLGAYKRCREELGCGLAVAKAIIENLNEEWTAAKEPPKPAQELAPEAETSSPKNP